MFMARDPSSKIQRGERITLTIDQQEVNAYAGETIATVLLAQGFSHFNQTLKGQARGPYCNMGTCFECQVKLADEGRYTLRWVRACMVPARQGMIIHTGAAILADPGTASGDLCDRLSSEADGTADHAD
jgi:sarcosine oxidase subunit alpha